MTRIATIAIAAATAACSIGPVDLDGKQCPCADGWTCDPATNTCVAGPADAPPGTPDAVDGPPADAPPAASCLGAAGAELVADDFPDLIGWTTVDGAWAAVAGEAVQSNASTVRAYASPDGTGAFDDYRVTVTARWTSGAGSVQAVLRLQPGNSGQYDCTWNPTTGALTIQWIRTNGNFGDTLVSTTVDTGSIPGYDPTAPVTLEAQAAGMQLSCCVREIPGAMRTTNDGRYDAGSPGIKTNAAAAAFGTFRVNAP